uniref:Uncharacterized protein n=1 Tax=Anguilla anguilla TaxID=7936 RepID=A0A0E9Q4Q7_ANGAN
MEMGVGVNLLNKLL